MKEAKILLRHSVYTTLFFTVSQITLLNMGNFHHIAIDFAYKYFNAYKHEVYVHPIVKVRYLAHTEHPMYEALCNTNLTRMIIVLYHDVPRGVDIFCINIYMCLVYGV